MKKTYLILAVVILVLVAAVSILASRLMEVKSERDIQLKNVETLFSDVNGYKVNDSLQAATISNLQLTLKQYAQFRAEDAKLISSLKVDNKRLQSIVSTQTESYYEHTTILRDSVKMLSEREPDSIKVPIIVKTANFEDNWHRLNVVIDGDSLTYKLKTRESLIITSHVVPKRFLWFKFGCKEVRTDVVSKNPYVESINVESVTIR